MKQRILVVEDNSLNSELLRDWLEMQGYEAVIAADLRAAFASVESQKPRVVLLDIQLGAEDGLSLASWMRQQPALCRIPVIAVTAQAMVSERQHILESGCNAIVPKPIDFSALQDQLDLCLKLAGGSQGDQPARKE
jgi:CheY-like chemotaxis protein